MNPLQILSNTNTEGVNEANDGFIKSGSSNDYFLLGGGSHTLVSNFATYTNIAAAYYTKTQLQTSGQASVNWGNLTNIPSTFPATAHTHPISQVTDLQTTLNGLTPVQSIRDFADGTLITTSIDYSQAQGNAWLLEITGNTYGSTTPLNVQVQGYIYSNTIISYSGISNSPILTSIIAKNLNGKLCFWFPRLDYWQGFTVICRNVTSVNPANRVESITNAVDVLGTKRVTIPINILAERNWATNNFISNSHAANGITSTNITNWNTAVGWGNHANAGYVTLGTEQVITARKVIRKNLATNDYLGTAQHYAQFEIGKISDTKSLEFAVTDDGVSYIQSKEAGVGYHPLVLNPNNIAGVGIGMKPINNHGLSVSSSIYTTDGLYGTFGSFSNQVTTSLILATSIHSSSFGNTYGNGQVANFGGSQLYLGNPSLPTIYFETSNTASGVLINGNKVWHAGNDGASSGLDADLLDGLQSSSYLSAASASSDFHWLENKFGFINGTTSNLGGITSWVGNWINIGSSTLNQHKSQLLISKTELKFRTMYGADDAAFNTVWHSGNFDPATKVNSWENALAIGFSSSILPNASGSQYPYIYHSTGGYVALATQLFTNTNFLKKNNNSVSVYGSSFITGGSNSSGTKIVLPHLVSSHKMMMFTVRMYQNYVYYDIVFSGYLYEAANNWYSPQAELSVGNVSIRVKMGRDTDNRAYVWVDGGNYTNIAVLDIITGHVGGDSSTGWDIIATGDTPNVVLDQIIYPNIKTNHVVNAITSTNITNWNTAVGWGNHAGLYSPINHSHTFASVTSKPTTISGYGITDAVTISGNQTITGVKTFNNGLALAPGTKLFTKGAADIAHYIGWFSDDTDGFGVSSGFSVKSYDAGTTYFLSNSVNSYVKGNPIWHSGNFNPGNYLTTNTIQNITASKIFDNGLEFRSNVYGKYSNGANALRFEIQESSDRADIYLQAKTGGAVIRLSALGTEPVFKLLNSNGEIMGNGIASGSPFIHMPLPTARFTLRRFGDYLMQYAFVIGGDGIFEGNLVVTNNITAAAFYESSVRELKENIQPFTQSGLELVEKLDIVTFDRKDKTAVNKIGIIADDSPNEFLSEELDAVDLYKTVFIQAKAIQELKSEIDELKELVKQLLK